MYLLEETEESREMRANVVSLARSEVFANTMIAVQLIKNNGFHKDFENLDISIENQRLLWNELFPNMNIHNLPQVISSPFSSWFTFAKNVQCNVEIRNFNRQVINSIRLVMKETRIGYITLENELWSKFETKFVRNKLRGLHDITASKISTRYNEHTVIVLKK